MAKQFDALQEAHRAFIEDSHIFFCGTAGPEGRVNVSPKGTDSLRVQGPDRISWLNLSGSGNETAGHVLQTPRMTLMWCSFTARPLILRVYGTARVIHRNDPDWAEAIAPFGARLGARQVFDLEVDLVQTSCGYAVPFMEFAGERDTLDRSLKAKGEAGIRADWIRTNSQTIDGAPTGIEANLE